MKNIFNYSAIVFLSFFLFSCEITNIDDFENVNGVSEASFFTSPEAAENGLHGAYNKTLLNFSTWFYNMQDHGMMGIELAFSFGSPNEFGLNDIQTTGSGVEVHYSEPYVAINVVNYLIEGTEGMDDSNFEGNRKNEILGEARFLRAQQHFNLLRSFGQFWDLNSEYGIVTNSIPNREITIRARSTVQETYDFILQDLDFAIANAPAFSSSIFASKEAAQAYKAKVLMFTGQYAAAASLCDEVINGGAFILEASYGDVFTETFESSEAILVNYWDDFQNNQNTIKSLFYAFLNAPTPTYSSIMTDADPRKPFVLEDGFLPFLPKKIVKYREEQGTFYMRLPEVYLIKAESLARTGNLADLTQAQAA